MDAKPPAPEPPAAGDMKKARAGRELLLQRVSSEGPGADIGKSGDVEDADSGEGTESDEDDEVFPVSESMGIKPPPLPPGGLLYVL